MLELCFYMQISTHNIILTVILITSIFLLAAAFLVLYVRLYNERKGKYIEEKKMMVQEFEKQLLQSQLETQEETFNHLAKEIHDNVGQLLNSAKLLIGVTQRTISNPPDTLAIADKTLGKAINELRSLSKSLDKEWLEQFNFIENLEAEIKRINAANSLHISFVKPDILSMKPGEQIILFRIVQEVLQNAIKHAQAKHIQIIILQVDQQLVIRMVDDGSGFDESTSLKGMGILNIKHRTHLLGGMVEWQSPGKGTVVNIQIPVKPEEI